MIYWPIARPTIVAAVLAVGSAACVGSQQRCKQTAVEPSKLETRLQTHNEEFVQYLAGPAVMELTMGHTSLHGARNDYLAPAIQWRPYEKNHVASELNLIGEMPLERDADQIRIVVLPSAPARNAAPYAILATRVDTSVRFEVHRTVVPQGGEDQGKPRPLWITREMRKDVSWDALSECLAVKHRGGSEDKCFDATLFETMISGVHRVAVEAVSCKLIESIVAVSDGTVPDRCVIAIKEFINPVVYATAALAQMYFNLRRVSAYRSEMERTR